MMNKIEKGDLVIKRGRHEAKVYFVEDFDEESILLVNGVRDEYFEGEADIELFHKQYRLLTKARCLIDDEMYYYLKSISPILRECGRDYLIKNKDTEKFCTGTLGCSREFYQIIFTESEINQMDITGFDKIEVTP